MVKYDAQTFSNISANTAAFPLQGGKYGFDMVASGSGTVKLQKQCQDGTTYVSVASATDLAATPGYGVADCPPGLYRLTVATFTGISACVSRIPEE